MKIQSIQPNINIYGDVVKQNIPPKSVLAPYDIKELSSNHYPVSFYGEMRTSGTDKPELFEKSGSFQVSSHAGVTCPACGKKMLNYRKMEQIYSALSNLPPDKYLDYIGLHRAYMRPVEESVYGEILALSKQPGQTKDIRKLLVQLREKKLPVLQDVQLKILKKMEALAASLKNEEERKALQNKLKNLRAEVRRNKTSSPFRRKIMIERIKRVKIQNKEKYEQLQNYARSFPSSKDMNSAWIVKYSGQTKTGEDWKSFDIALRFFSSSIANTDHILAYDIENNC